MPPSLRSCLFEGKPSLSRLTGMSPAAVERYAEENLRSLGQGSTRRVYLWDSKRVLKVAKNDMGLRQTLGEVDVWQGAHGPAKRLLARLHGWDPGGHWLLMELVRPLRNEDEFEQLSGVSFETAAGLFEHGPMDDAWRDEVLAGDDEWLKLPAKEWLDPRRADILRRLWVSIKELHIYPPDMEHVDHWGKGADGRLAILDYGLTLSNIEGYDWKTGWAPDGDR